MTDLAPPHGVHLIADLKARAGLDDLAFVELVLHEAAEAARSKLIAVRLHHFGEGGGVTGIALLAESHISIHTWPEHGLVAADIFTCGATSRPQSALDHIAVRFAATTITTRRIERLADPATNT